jgi:Zn-dependent oligopeptidase
MQDIRFNFNTVTEEQLSSLPELIYDEIKEVYDSIVNIQEPRTFENTVQPIINVETKLQPLISSLGYVTNFFTDEKLSEVANESQTKISKLLVELTQRKDFFKAYEEYEKNGYKNDYELLTDEEKRYFNHTMREFRRNGLDRDDPDIEKLKKRLAGLQNDYMRNLNEYDEQFIFTLKELEGMPETWFNPDKLSDIQDSEENPSYIITLKYPDYVPAMDYVKDSTVRKKLAIAYNNKCAKENTPLFEETVKLRSVLAKKLGYANHVDFSTEVNVVKNGKTATEFLQNLNSMLTPLYEEEMINLTKFAKKYEINPLQTEELEQWDLSYYLRAYKEHELDLDMQKVREYFPLDKVRKGLFEIYQKLLRLKFTTIDTENKWHDTVQLYKVEDSETGVVFGYFYLDMYPRKGKYSHAAVFPFQSNCLATNNPCIDGDCQYAVMAMACNFPKDECIEFNDVVTFFHEFGHVMHQICSQTQLANMTSFNVEHDFVEAPSQMLENWCYTKEALELMSSHKDTGETIPDEMIQKLRKIKSHMQGYRNKRQIFFGLFDLETHSLDLDSDSEFDSQKLWKKVYKEVLNKEEMKDVNRVASFAHLMGGYDAGYYGYLRAETYAANMFYKVFDGDVMNPEKGLHYRKVICEQGSTKDAIELLKEFLGEEPDDSYFLKEKGL